MASKFWDAVEKRRSIYGFTGEKPVSEDRIVEIAQKALLNVPSPFNSQSTRLTVLFGEQHKKLWDIVLDALKKVTDANGFEQSKQKVEGLFKSGYGTVLFFVDNAPVDALMRAFPLYADKFPVWAQHSNAMHQFAVWTGLADEGLGASLQHYNPLIDEAVRREWGLPDTWSLVAQMPFGVAAEAPDEKEQQPLDARLKVFR